MLLIFNGIFDVVEEGGMRQSLHQKFFVPELVVYLGFDEGEMSRKYIGLLFGDIEIYFQGRLGEYPERVKEGLAVIQVFIFEVEDADQCLHYVCVHLSGDVLVALVVFIVFEDVNLCVAELLLVPDCLRVIVY